MYNHQSSANQLNDISINNSSVKQFLKMSTSDVHQRDGENILFSNDNSKVEDNRTQQINPKSIHSDFGQDTQTPGDSKQDLRIGEIFRAKWADEQMVRKSLQSSTSFADSDFNSINLKQQQEQLQQIVPLQLGSQQNMVMRFIKTHELQHEASPTSNRRGSAKISLEGFNENGTPKNNNDMYESTYRSKVNPQRSGRLSHRFKPEDLLFESGFRKKKNVKSQIDGGTRLDSQESIDLEQTQKQRSQKKINRTPHEVWLSGFFNILIFFNRFVYRNKQRMLHFKPQDLLDNQWQAINDLAAHNQHEGENKQQIRDNIFRSRFKIVRKFRIFWLLTRKKLKLCIMPLMYFNRKMMDLTKQALDPIPVILPYYKLSLFWDFVNIFFIFANVFKIPFEIAFTDGQRMNKELTDASRLIFFLNFFMSINTAYYENGVLQKNRTKIFFHFLKSRLIIDVLAYLCLWFSPFGVSWLRVFFLIKYFSFYEIIEKLAESLQLSNKYSFIVNLITLLVEILILCHLFACLWFIVGDYQDQRGLQPNWVSTNNLSDASIGSQYISSLYFSMITIGTIGFGDIVPKNDLEKAFISGMAILSSGIFGYILTNIQNVYKEYNVKQEAYLTNLSELNNYMFSRDVNPNLQQMARKYLKYVHQQNFQKGVMPSHTLNILSKFLREEIIEEIFKRSINNIQFLSQFSPQFKHALSIKMKEINYGPDEMIMKAGSYQQPSLYYILKGRVEISLDSGNNKGVQYNSFYENKPFFEHMNNESFGQFEFISQSHQMQTNAKSLEVTTIHQISLVDFIDVINQFSTDKEKYIEMKDKLNLYQYYTSSKVFCHSCKSSQHLLKDCPVFFYKPIKQRIINQFNVQSEVSRKEVKRQQGNRLVLNALAFQYEIEDDCIFFREENQSELGSMIQLDSEEDELKKQKTVKKSQLDAQSLNFNQLDKPALSRLSATLPRLSQSQNTNNSSPQIFTFEPKILEEKDEESRRESKISENKKKSRTSTSFGSMQNVKEMQKTVDQLTPSSSSSSSSSSDSSSETSSKKKKKDKGSRASINDINSPHKAAVHRKSLNRINTKHEFQKKATLLAARTKKNWNIDDKNKLESDLGVVVAGPAQPRPSQISQNIASDIKSLNQLKNVKRAITIGQMQHVLEQMQMQNAQKAAKQQFEPIDDVITETVRTFKIYMVHNNVGNVIKEYHKCKLKERARKKRLKQGDNKPPSNESPFGTKLNLSHKPISQKSKDNKNE